MKFKNKKVAKKLYNILGWGLASLIMYLLGIDPDGYLGPAFFGIIVGMITLHVIEKLVEY